MRSYLFGFCALSVVLALVSCKGSEMVKAQEDFAVKTCACKDVACIKGVQQEQDTWVTKNGQSGVGSESDGEKIAAANKKMTDCADKIISAAH